METTQATFAVKLPGDVPVCIFALITCGRSPTLPVGGQWIGDTGWWQRDPTTPNVEAALRKAFPPGQPQPVSWRRINPGVIPIDASYRNAWIDDGVVITHDMPKARELYRDKLRSLRERMLTDLDGQWMKAVGQGDIAAQAAVEKERQKWRDAPADPRIDAATTVDELKAIVISV